MQDVVYLLTTVGFFGLMWLFVLGCDRVIGREDQGSVPGGDEVEETTEEQVRS